MTAAVVIGGFDRRKVLLQWPRGPIGVHHAGVLSVPGGTQQPGVYQLAARYPWLGHDRFVLEDQPGLDAIHLGPGREGVEREVAEMVGVARP